MKPDTRRHAATYSNATSGQIQSCDGSSWKQAISHVSSETRVTACRTRSFKTATTSKSQIQSFRARVQRSCGTLSICPMLLLWVTAVRRSQPWVGRMYGSGLWRHRFASRKKKTMEVAMRIKGPPKSQRSHTLSIPWQKRTPSRWTRNQKALARPTCGKDKSSAAAEGHFTYRDIRKRVCFESASRAWRCLRTTRKSTVAAADASIRASRHLRRQGVGATARHSCPSSRGFHSLRYNHKRRASRISMRFRVCLLHRSTESTLSRA